MEDQCRGFQQRSLIRKHLKNNNAGKKVKSFLKIFRFDGYYKAPEKKKESFIDGWFRRRLGVIDSEGHIEFHGRIKDMLKVGGENVAAIEIESLLSTHPAVNIAQVIGVHDARLFEVARLHRTNRWEVDDRDRDIDFKRENSEF